MARECIAVRVRVLNRIITSIYDTALRPLRLKTSQLNILVVAGKLGLASPTDVCKILHMDASTLSRNVEKMKARGWLKVTHGGDARAQPFELTSAGKRILQRSFPAWERAQREAARVLGLEGEALLKTLSQKVGPWET